MAENENVKQLKMDVQGAQHVVRAMQDLAKFGITVEDLTKKIYDYTKNLVSHRAVMEQQLDAYTKMAVSLDKTNGPWAIENIRITENTQALKENLAAQQALLIAKGEAAKIRAFTSEQIPGTTLIEAGPGETLKFASAQQALEQFVIKNQVAAEEVMLIWKRASEGLLLTTPQDARTQQLQQLVYNVQQAEAQMGQERKQAIEKSQQDFIKSCDTELAALRKTEQEKERIFKQTIDKRIAQEQEAARIRRTMLEEQRQEQERLAGLKFEKEGMTIGASLFGRIDFTKATMAQKIATLNAIEGIRQFATQNQISLKQVDQMWAQLASGSIKQYTGATQQLQSQLYGLQQQTKNFGETHKATTQSVLLSWQSIGRILAAQALRRVFFELISAMQQSITTAKELSLAIGEIRTVSQRSQLTTSEWSRGLIQLSNSFGLDVLDQAEGAYQAISNQVVQGAEAFRFMAEANKFAVTTVATTEQSVNLLSSVINAFGMQAKDAEYISAVLFKTIELGRVRAEEMANTFGDIAILANQVGVTFEELTATISTLTIQGVKYNHAATQVRGIMQKLLQPTNEMKKFFHELGVATGEEAIEVYGLNGVLIKMREYTHGSTTEMAKLINRIRGVTGALGLTKDGVKAFTANLEANKQALASYRQAVADSMEAVGRTVQIEMTRIKNVFIESFGEKMLYKFAEISKAVGGLDTVLKALTNTISGLLIDSTSRWITLISSSMMTIAMFSRLMRMHNPWVLAAEGIGLAIGALAVYLNKLADAQEAEEERRQQAAMAAADVAEQNTDVIIRAYTLAYTEIGRLAKRAATEVIAQENKRVDAILKTIEANKKAIEAITKEATKAIETNIKALEKGIEKSEKTIDQLLDKISSSIHEQADIEFDIKWRLEDEDPTVVVKKLYAEIDRLQKQAGASFVVGDVDTAEEDVKRIFKLQERIIKIVDDAQRKRVALNKQEAEAREKFDKDNAKLLNKTNKARITDVEDLLREEQSIKDELNNQLIEIAKQREAIGNLGKGENDINAILKARRDLVESINNQRKAALDNERQMVTEFEKDKNRLENIKQSLIDVSEAIRAFDLKEALAIKDPKARMAAFQKQAELLREQLNIKTDADVLSEQEKKRLEENIISFQKLADSQREIAEIQLRQKEINALVEKGKQTIEDAGKALIENTRQYAKQQEYIKQTVADLEALKASSGPFAFLSGANLARITNIGGDENYIRLLTKDYETAATKAAELGKKLAAAKTIGDIIKIKTEIEKLQKELTGEQDVLTKYFKGSTEELRLALAPAMTGLSELLEHIGVLNIQAERLGGAQDILNAMRTFEAASNEAARLTTELLKKQDEATGKTENNIKGIVASTRDAVTSITEFTNQLLAITEQLEGVRQIRKEMIEAEGIQLQARGGAIHAHGSDRIPALLSPGEFVVNARSTRKFFSQLSAINAGNVPRFERGGEVTTTIGDINVSLHSTGSEAVDIVKIGNGLRRAIRQGRVKL